MQPIRQILEDAPATIAIPREMQHRRVEIMFWPLDEPASELTESAWPAGFFEAREGCLADDPIARGPQGDYEPREDLQ